MRMERAQSTHIVDVLDTPEVQIVLGKVLHIVRVVDGFGFDVFMTCPKRLGVSRRQRAVLLALGDSQNRFLGVTH